MKYTNISYGSQLLPKLIGTYEKELHPILNAILKIKYDYVINIGAGRVLCSWYWKVNCLINIYML